MKENKSIDPNQEQNWYRPLWCVSGPTCFPTVFCCKIVRHPSTGLTIWGYSVYRKQPGFRTLGVSLATWMQQASNQPAKFFADQSAALEYVAALVTPRCEA